MGNEFDTIKFFIENRLYRSEDRESLSIPEDLINDPENTKKTIEFLKMMRTIQKGRVIYNTLSFKNKIKYHLLGYVLMER